jgi:hypothetical protein
MKNRAFSNLPTTKPAKEQLPTLALANTAIEGDKNPRRKAGVSIG